MTTRTIGTLPADLVSMIFQLGTRKLVLLEGDDDVEVIKEWFREDLGDILFYAAEGNMNVESYLNSILSYSSRREIYGIIDRDFRTDEEVTHHNTDENTRLYILYRYAIENYLLEPLALFEELKVYHGRNFTETEETISRSLLDICGQLKTMMAANWIIKESDTGADYFSKGHQISDRDDIIRQASVRLQLDIETAEERIREKENIIESKSDGLYNAYTFINGKHIFHQIYEIYVNSVKRGLRKDHLRNLLTRTIKEKIGIHDNLIEIIKRRILLK